ncbi:MAG: rRNA pseudouridine synthase [Clostridiales bacterium]|nr:rRNA pseudouridine synthase [Clostridiales bacterium]
MPDNKIRLQKYLSESGVCSRRKAEELIAAGKVKINGHPAEIGAKVDPKSDIVTVSGKKVSGKEKPIYIMLHKPRGYITTLSDERGRKCVTELLSGIKERVYPIGRLDRDSEGLLLLTNDGEFANLMMHPKHHIPKTYRVTVRPDISDKQIHQLSVGIPIEGRMTAPADVRLIEKTEGRAVAEIVLYEGRNREIRKMCEALELEVARLKRTAVGSLKLGMLPTGKWRELTPDEVERLASLAEKEDKTKNKNR